MQLPPYERSEREKVFNRHRGEPRAAAMTRSEEQARQCLARRRREALQEQWALQRELNYLEA